MTTLAAQADWAPSPSLAIKIIACYLVLLTAAYFSAAACCDCKALSGSRGCAIAVLYGMLAQPRAQTSTLRSSRGKQNDWLPPRCPHACSHRHALLRLIGSVQASRARGAVLGRRWSSLAAIAASCCRTCRASVARIGSGSSLACRRWSRFAAMRIPHAAPYSRQRRARRGSHHSRVSRLPVLLAGEWSRLSAIAASSCAVRTLSTSRAGVQSRAGSGTGFPAIAVSS
jgi:hypothetical protein